MPRVTRLLLALPLIFGGATGYLLGGGYALSDLNFSSYVWHQQNMSSKHEPINVLFTINGTLANAETHLYHHTTFREPVCSAALNFYDHQTWESFQEAWATGGAACAYTRDHVRLNQHNDDGGTNFGTFTMGPTHYEDSPGGCYAPGHRNLSFNIGRDDIWLAFGDGGHETNSYYHGNTDSYTQCDGFTIQGDGWVRRLVIP